MTRLLFWASKGCWTAIAVSSALLIGPVLAGERFELVDVDVDQFIPLKGYSVNADMSPDGRYVALVTASPLSEAIGFTTKRVYVRDRESGTVKIVSVALHPALPFDLTANGDSNGPALSVDGCPDGRYRVAFYSAASDLIENDTNGKTDVFLVDCSGVTSRVSVSTQGAEADGDSDDQPAIARDGRYVAFASKATNLGVANPDGHWNLYLRDTLAGTTTPISVPAPGPGTPGDSRAPSMSVVGGRIRIAFWSSADNLVANDTNGGWDIFLYDSAATPKLSKISVDAQDQAKPGPAVCDAPTEPDVKPAPPAISGNGRYVAFASECALVAADHNGKRDIYIRDLQTQTTTLASVGPDGQPRPGHSPAQWDSRLGLSYDGRYLAFAAAATADPVSDTEILLRDSELDTVTSLLSPAQFDYFGNRPTRVAVSDDGKRVSFNSRAKGLDPRFPNDYGVYVYDLLANLTPVAVPSTPRSDWKMGETVLLEGSQSYDRDGTPLAGYRWTVTQKYPCVLDLSNSCPPVDVIGADTVSANFVPPMPGNYVATLKVNDGQLDSPVVELPIVVLSEHSNQIPVASVRERGFGELFMNGVLGGKTVLDGSYSTDPDNQPKSRLSYRWTFTAAPTGFKRKLTNARTAKPSFVASRGGVYELNLVVNDGADDSLPVKVTVSVSPYIRAWAPDDGVWTVGGKAGGKEELIWSYDKIRDKQTFMLSLSTDGGEHWKPIKTVRGGVDRRGSTRWKVGKRFVSENAVFRVCVRNAKRLGVECDDSDPFAIRP